MKRAKIFTVCIFMFISIQLAASDFYFVQITDTHQGDAKHNKRLNEIISTIKSLPQEIAFVVHTGDVSADNLSLSNNAKTFYDVYSSLECPVYFTPGNHDIIKYHGNKRMLSSHEAWTNHFSPLNYTAECDGVRLVFVFMENIRENYQLPGHNPEAWLAETLESEPEKPVLLFQHSPVARDFYQSSFEQAPTYKDPWGSEFRENYSTLVNGGVVKAIFGGHYHRDELHYVGDVPLFVSSSVAGYWGRQATFRIYHYKDGRISYQTVYIED